MPKRIDTGKEKEDDELARLILTMRFGGAAPDKSAQVYFSLPFLARAVRKSLTWVQRVINQSMPVEQRIENKVRDWGTLDTTYREGLCTAELR